MKNFFKDFFENPILPTMTAVFTIAALAFVASPEDKPQTAAEKKVTSARLAALQSDTVQTSAEADKSAKSLTPVISDITYTTAAETSYSTNEINNFYIETFPAESETGFPESTDDLAVTSTEITTSETTETTTVSTAEPHVYSYDYISAGTSPNSSFYQDRLAVIGDSIASGFNAYGYIPYEHNIAKESLAVWNMDSYYFDVAGYSTGVIDTADYVNAPLYFISIGMNDIYGCSPSEYGLSMLSIAQQVLERVPTATIIVGAITPIADWNGYTSNETIREFNYSLQTSINGAGNPQILFFDTYSVLADPWTLALSDDHSGGDGMHLSSYSYQYILDCLFSFLDYADVIEQINIHDTTGY